MQRECLKLKDLTITDQKEVLVKNFSMTIFKDEIFVLIGKNGCGKSKIL